MLDEQVGGPDLARISASAAAVSRPGAGIGAVELGHVDLELLGVCSWWGLPAGVTVVRVEVVGQVLGVAVAHLPVGREAGLGLGQGQRRVSKVRSVRRIGSDSCI